MSFNTEQKDALKSIFKEKEFRYYKEGKFIFSGNRKPGTITNFLKTVGSPECFEAQPCLITLTLSILKKSIPVDDLMEVIKEYTEENKFDPTQEVNTIDIGDDAEDDIAYVRSLIPAINISSTDKNKIILLDPHRGNRPALDIDPEYYLMLNHLNYQDMVQNQNVMRVMTCFDPYSLESVTVKMSKTGSVRMPHVNYYIPSRWRFLDVAPAYTGFIKTLIEHLFPNPHEREYVLDWLHYALVKRNDTVLCLIGARGTGKGILMNNIISALVGEEYHQVAKQEVLTDKFNAEFKNKRFVFFDEVNVSGDRELAKFKAFANNKIAMEAKGHDSETIDNFVSMGLSSNDKKDFKAEPQERRFSVPEVTEVPLLDIFTEEEIESFCVRVADPESEEIAAFGNFLIKRVPKHTSQRPLKGRYFFDLCRLSMPEWKTFIIDHLITQGEIGEPITNKHMAKLFERAHGDKIAFPTRRATIETFLGDYIHEGDCRIGSMVDVRDEGRGRNTFGIMPNEKFLQKFGLKYSERDSALDEL